MPIRIPDGLPSRDALLREGVDVLNESVATRQDIRPMQIALLNLMPNKIETEKQIARLIGGTPLQVELTLVRMSGHEAKNTSKEHLLSFYSTWEDVKDRKFDGLIITGAPIEKLDFQDVTYWDELTQILDWTKTNVHSSFFICWGAMAAVNYFHDVPKHTLEQKAFGVFRHHNRNPSSPFLAGFSDDFSVSVSRWTEVRNEDIPTGSPLKVLMESDETGLCLLQEDEGNRLYIFNHIEYDSTSLADEYFRDVEAGKEMQVPANYFPDDDTSVTPINRWRSHAFLLFGNWINQMYQTTSFKLSDIGTAHGGDSKVRDDA